MSPPGAINTNVYSRTSETDRLSIQSKSNFNSVEENTSKLYIFRKLMNTMPQCNTIPLQTVICLDFARFSYVFFLQILHPSLISNASNNSNNVIFFRDMQSRNRPSSIVIGLLQTLSSGTNECVRPITMDEGLFLDCIAL